MCELLHEEAELHFENMTVSGQGMIWMGCDEEWCTHCLTKDYFVGTNGEVGTVVDRHPPPRVSDSYYQRSQCQGNEDVPMFQISASSSLSFLHSHLSDLRVRAQAFVKLISGNVTFQHTVVTGLEFASAFIWRTDVGADSNVLIEDSVVTGLNRDHPYTFRGDTGLIIAAELTLLVVRNSIFRDNFLMPNTEKLSNFLRIDRLKSFEMTNSQVIRCMGSFALALDPAGDPFGLLISNSSYEYSFADSAPHWKITLLSAANVTFSEFRFENNHNSYSSAQFLVVTASAEGSRMQVLTSTFANNLAKSTGTALFDFQYLSELEFDRCVFDDNGDYFSESLSFNLFLYLLSEKLLDDSDLLRKEHINISVSNACEFMVRLQSNTEMLFHTSSLLATSGLCLNLLTLDSSGEGNKLIATFDDVLVSNNNGYGLSILVREDGINIAAFANCIFRNIGWGAIYFYTYTLAAAGLRAHNCTFENVGDFAGNEAAIDVYGGGYLVLTDCVFLTNRGSRAGAVFFLQLSQNLVHGDDLNDAVLQIVRCVFVNNTSPQMGGDVYLFSPEGSAPISILIRDCFFSHSFAKQSGGSLSLSNIRLKTALIDNCTFHAASSGRGGIVSLEHTAGRFDIANLKFLEIDDEKATLIYVQTPTNTSKTEVYTAISGLVVQGCNYLAGVRIDSGAGVPTVHMRNSEFRENFGIAIWNDYGVVRDWGSVYMNNTSVSSPCVYQSSKSKGKFEDCWFEGNSASEQAGVMDIRGPSTSATFINCTFFENQSLKVDGVARIEKSCNVHFRHCLFIRNSAKVTSLFEVQNVNECVDIIDSFIKENRGDGLFTLENSYMNLRRVSISNNQPGSSEAGFVLLQSQLTIRNSSITGVTGSNGCIVNAYVASFVTVANSYISDIVCEQDAFRITAGSSLSIEDTRITQVKSHFASVIFATDSNFLDFHRVQVEHVHIGDVTSRDNQAFISAKLTPVTISETSFRDMTVAVLQGTDLPLLVMTATRVQNVSAARNIAGAVFCSGCNAVRVVDSEFERIIGKEFGGVRVEMSDNVTLSRCAFRSIAGGSQGALSIVSARAKIEACNFEKNTASDAESSQAGGLFLSSEDGTIENCVFTANTAREGGAIYWNFMQPGIYNTCFFSNTADYGPDFATFPTSLRQSNDIRVFTAASGQPFLSDIRVELTDPYGQVILNDNKSEAWLTAASKKTKLSGSLKAVATMGVFHFSDFVMTDAPGQAINLTVASQAARGEDTSLTLMFDMRSCETGEILSENACLVCPVEFFSLTPHATACQRCPNYAICKSGAEVYPEVAAWRPSVDSALFFKCFRLSSCLGHDNFTSLTGKCIHGYTGNLCQTCDVGFSRSTRDVCRMCPARSVSIATITCAAVGFTLFIFVTVKSSLRSTESKDLKLSLAMKVLMNYLQLLMLTLSFSLNWPERILGVLSSQDILGVVYEQLFGFGCFVSKDRIHPIFVNLFIVVTLPLALLVGSLLPWLFVSYLRKTKLQKDKCVGTMIVLLLILHPAIVKTCFSLFNCFEVLPGEKWMREEMDVRCWKSQHEYLSLGIALPGVLTWGVFVPGIILLVLIRKRKVLNELYLRRMFGFLYLGYKKESQCFWEFVILYRKVVMIGCYVFLSGLTPTSQALIMLTLLVAALGLQLKYSPFINPKMNELEVKSVLVSSLVIYSGLYFVSEEVSLGAQVFLFIIILATHVSFLLSWLWMVTVIFLRCVHRKHSNCFEMYCGFLLRHMSSLRKRTISNDRLNYSTEIFDRRKVCELWLRGLFLDRIRHGVSSPCPSPEPRIWVTEISTLCKI